MQDMQGKKVMIVRGVGGREVLADTLKSRGANVTFAECYQRINPQQNVDALTTAWSKQQLQAIVVTSSEAMRHLLDLASNEKWLKQVTLCVNHARIAEQAIQLGLKVKIAEAPGDEAMLNILLNMH
jgi:uroporphyrinogen-III synthase